MIDRIKKIKKLLSHKKYKINNLLLAEKLIPVLKEEIRRDHQRKTRST
ncbi:MAG: hypothetical protein HYS98_06985 [Deltaproteobacteria bacterium]|nr:hypothetical protein [Deltaproteobacteria bacterium]